MNLSPKDTVDSHPEPRPQGAGGAAGLTDPKVGWIGLGRMGMELAQRLLAAGLDVAVWNRTAAKAQPLVERGARAVETPADLAACDVVVTMVSASDVLEEVTLGEKGLFAGSGSAPAVLIDSSTVSAQASQRVRERAASRDCALVAAPVSGNPKVARAGRLSVVTSGPRAAYELVLPVLELFGESVTYVGEGERSRLVKICHNLLLGVTTQVLAETLVLAERGGVRRSAYLDFLNHSVMGSVFSRYKTPALVNLDYTPTFTSHLLRKDLELGLDEGRQLDVPLPVVSLVHQLVTQLSTSELADADFAALLTQQARAAGVELEPEDVDVSDCL
ncbi:NAD(P)-dependent oxidoreductase [Phytoactinopolyspora limicola]|uniref:NAD(P)-dependent oxidoreductase n=1 Tax=Phytoactinopolyspora limicola TaxID=2715536 RepID=UPI00140E1E65|nr:NAD(P)-dependent oxidoreductase [Phytoactinopolyspora limicola]